MNLNHKSIKIIQTTKGQLRAETDTNSIRYIFFHQILTTNIFNGPFNRPINLEHYSYHLKNPLSLENTSLTPGLLDHQLQNLVQAANCSHNQILIMDSSNYQTKIVELFDKYLIVKGYSYRLEGIYQTGVLLSYDHILKQIQYQFKLGNGKFKPGFIGEILVSQCLKDSPYFNAYRAYLSFSQKTDCPIIVNCLETGQNPVYTISLINQSSAQDQKYTVISLQKKFNQLKQMLDYPTLQKAKLVIFNIPLIFTFAVDSHTFQQKIICRYHETIVGLIQRHPITIGFDLLRYSNSRQAINYIALLINKYPNKIIMTNGLRYKTDLSTFGGDGYRFNTYQPQLSQLYHRFTSLANKSVLEQVFYKNQLNLLLWKTKLQEIQIEVTWQCDKCGLTQSQKIQKFRKFGKQFCSIKCLKSCT